MYDVPGLRFYTGHTAWSRAACHPEQYGFNMVVQGMTRCHHPKPMFFSQFVQESVPDAASGLFWGLTRNCDALSCLGIAGYVQFLGHLHDQLLIEI
jgi:hypothetical protein